MSWILGNNNNSNQQCWFQCLLWKNLEQLFAFFLESLSNLSVFWNETNKLCHSACSTDELWNTESPSLLLVPWSRVLTGNITSILLLMVWETGASRGKAAHFRRTCRPHTERSWDPNLSTEIHWWKETLLTGPSLHSLHTHAGKMRSCLLKHLVNAIGFLLYPVFEWGTVVFKTIII